MDNKNFYMNSAEVLDRSFDIYKKSFWQQIAYSFIVSSIGSVVIAITTFVITFFGIMALVPFSLGRLDVDTLPVPIIIVLVVLFIIILLLAYFQQSILTAGNITLAKQVFYTNKPNFSIAIKEAFKSCLRVFSVVLAEILVMIPFFLSFLGIGYLLLSEPIRQMMRFGPQARVDFPFVLVIIFGIFYLFIFLVIHTVFAVSVPVAIFEKKTFFKGLVQSYRLVIKDFPKIFGISLIWNIIVSIFMYSIIGVFFIALGGLGLVFDAISFDSDRFMMSFQIYEYVLSGILGVVVAPLSSILTSVIYFNQKIKNDGLDIVIGFERLKGEL